MAHRRPSNGGTVIKFAKTCSPTIKPRPAPLNIMPFLSRRNNKIHGRFSVRLLVLLLFLELQPDVCCADDFKLRHKVMIDLKSGSIVLLYINILLFYFTLGLQCNMRFRNRDIVAV